MKILIKESQLNKVIDQFITDQFNGPLEECGRPNASFSESVSYWKNKKNQVVLVRAFSRVSWYIPAKYSEHFISVFRNIIPLTDYQNFYLNWIHSHIENVGKKLYISDSLPENI